ncbi:MAG: HAMP domain-containing sensor histidine kinase [Terriglobales bacterium]
MRISSRRTAIAFFLSSGVILAALAFAVGSGWIILNWREGIKVFLGIIFFGAIITGLVLNTIFLVREIRRNEQHDSFINAVTHELKTPIASIRLYLETLQRLEVDEARRREFYQLMLVDTERLMSTVEQVLKAGALAQKKAKAQAQRVAVDLNSLVRDCVELARVRHHLAPENLDYREPTPATANAQTTTQVLGDPDELHTAVTNLLDNAVKYSPEGIHIAVELIAPDEEHVVLRVRDRGVGIAQNELKRIFKRFYRVRQRGRARVKGTGLGLFIVRAIARNHGGRVFAESEGAGKGTIVTLELPREVSKEVPRNASKEASRTIA